MPKQTPTQDETIGSFGYVRLGEYPSDSYCEAERHQNQQIPAVAVCAILTKEPLPELLDNHPLTTWPVCIECLRDLCENQNPYIGHQSPLSLAELIH